MRDPAPSKKPAGDWPRLKALLGAALDLPPSARAAFVEASCAGDADLKANLEALLAAHEEAGDFLESSSEVDRMAADVLGAEEPEPALRTGARLGPYEIVEMLDAGGMGEVYRARDSRLGRDVAIKVISPRLASDPERVRRFEGEARAAGALSDPNILAVYDVGAAEAGPYVVTELLEGETLGRRLAAGRLPAAEALDYALQIARGLVAAHDKGVVHRDLKPDNVFVTRQGRIKLLDFGLAKLLEGGPVEAEEGGIAARARRGSDEPVRSTIMGTPGYVAPERLEGGAGDRRADIFALGAILYRMLAGRPAFGTGTGAEALTATLADPRPLAASDGVPLALERLVSRCLARRPEDRFSSARDVVAALSEVTAGTAPRRAWGTVAAAALAVIVVALAGRTWMSGDSPRPAATPPIRALAVLPLANTSGDPAQDYFSDGITEGLIAEMARIPGLRVISPGSARAVKGATTSPSEIVRRLGVDAVVDGSVRRAESLVQVTVRLRARTGETLWSSTYDRPVRDAPDLQHDVASAIATELALAASPGDGHARPRHPAGVEAYEAYLRGRHYWNERSTAAAPRAIEQFNRALELDPLYAEAYAGLADTYLMLGDMLYLMPPRDAFARAEAAALRSVELDPSRSEAYATLGHLRMHSWQWVPAEQAFVRSIELNPGYASAHQWRAYNFASLGRLDDALSAIDRAQQLDPLSLIINADRAQILYFARRWSDAVAQCDKTLQMGADFAEARRVRFLALLRLRRSEEALAELERYRQLPDGGPGGSVGYAYGALGRPAEARQVLAALSEPTGTRLTPAYDIAAVYAGLDDTGRALSSLDQALTTHDPESMILPVDPRLDRLRGTPAFSGLLRRLGVPPP